MWKETKRHKCAEYEWKQEGAEAQNPLLLPVQNARLSHQGIDERNSANLFFILDVSPQNGESYKIIQTIGLCLLPEGFADVKRSLDGIISALDNVKAMTEGAEQLIPETGYLSSEIHGRGRMLRVHMINYEEIAKGFYGLHDSIIFGACQRIFPKGHTHVSDPHRGIEPEERAIIKPTILALLESLPILQPPYMKRERYVQLLNERF